MGDLAGFLFFAIGRKAAGESGTGELQLLKGENDGPVRSGDVNGLERGSKARGGNVFCGSAVGLEGLSVTLKDSSFLGRVGLGLRRWPKAAFEEELPGILRVKFCGLGGVKASSSTGSLSSPSRIMFSSLESCPLPPFCIGFARLGGRNESPARSGPALRKEASIGENEGSVGVKGDINKGEQDLPPKICRSDSAMGVNVTLLLRLNGEDTREGGEDIGEDTKDARPKPGGGIDIIF